MANSVDTAEGVGEGDSLKQWLIDNNLSNAIEKFQQTGTTFEELKEVASQFSFQDLQYVI